jgi:hypothetical protein
MHFKIFSLALLIAGSVAVVAQEETEDSCPGLCGLGPIDEDRLISDCTARCNTFFGDPEEAQFCVDTCSNWRDSIACEATTVAARRDPNPIERRRQASSAIEIFSEVEQLDAGNPDDLTDVELKESSGEPLERRDGYWDCVKRCIALSRTASICPPTSVSLGAQIWKSVLYMHLCTSQNTDVT